VTRERLLDMRAQARAAANAGAAAAAMGGS
jgi:hypothetical protein